MSFVASASAVTYYRAGDQLAAGELKAGDRILLRNPMCDQGNLSNGPAGINQWLNGTKQTANTSHGVTVDAMAVEPPTNGLTDDYVFILEEGPADPLTGGQTFYLKNAGNGAYFKGNWNSAYNCWYTYEKSEATYLLPEPAQDICIWWTQWDHETDTHTGWAFESSLCNDKTLVLTSHIDNSGNFRHFGPFWNYGMCYFSTVKDIIIWNAYVPVEDNSSVLALTNLVSGLEADATADVSYGSNPGQYDFDLMEDFRNAYDEAAALVQGALTEETAAPMLEKLQKAYEAAMASMVPITTGYYNFISSYTQYSIQQGVEKAMAASADSKLIWYNYDPEDAFQLFYVEENGDGTYKIKNIGSGEYIGTIAAQSAQLPTTKEYEVPQLFKAIGFTSEWNITNTQSNYSYHTAGHSSGAGISGTVANWNAGANSGSSWYVRPETDQELIDQLVSEAPAKLAAQKLADAITAAKNLRAQVVEDTKLVTDAAQYDANSAQHNGESTFPGLIDGHYEYWNGFHSHYDHDLMELPTTTIEDWEAYGQAKFEADPETRGVGHGYHNLQVRFNEPRDNFYRVIVGRGETSYVDAPKELEIYATNDDELGASTDQADLDNWTFVQTIDEGFPGAVPYSVYTSPLIQLDQAYKYVRFVVKNTGMVGRNARIFAQPEITGITWNVGEWQLYSTDWDSNCEYYAVPGMKEAVDALDPILDAAQEKVDNLTATEADVEELKAATQAVQDLYIDRDALDQDLAAAIEVANEAYDKATGSRKSILNDASQLSTNSSSANDSSTLAHLLDDNTHYDYNFHSIWEGTLMEGGATAEEWAAAVENRVKSNSNTIGVGIGYHDLQVKFDTPVDNFFFQITSRGGGTAWVDTPTDIGIYATNDDELGASADMANINDWNEIRRLNAENGDKMAEYNTNADTWFSPQIDLGDSYKYVRFVMYNTTRANGGRKYETPDITGITWNASCFRIYQGVDADHVQYNYDADYRVEVDALKALIDEAAALPAHSILDNEKAEALRALAAQVLADKVDTTNLNRTAYRLFDMVKNAAVGEGIGFVDAQESIDALQAAVVAAKAQVSPTQPTGATVKQAEDDLAAAYKAFTAHVNFPEPGKWYNIVSGATRDYATDKPIYLGSTSSDLDESKLYIAYPAAASDAIFDPYATWRLVPIEGTDDEFAIQSYGTGQYFGKYRGDETGKNAARPLMNHEKQAYKIVFHGKGTLENDKSYFKLVQTDATDSEENKLEYNALKADQSTGQICNYPLNSDDQQLFTFVPVDENQGIQQINYFHDNTIEIATFPFELKGDDNLVNLNEAMGNVVETYAIKALIENADGENALELKKQDDFEAGEPMIIVVGDKDAYEGQFKELFIPMVDNVVDASTVVNNGLHGTLTGETIATGLGVFVDAQLTTTTDNLFVAGRGGWINPTQIKNEDGEADLTIGTTLTDVKQIVKAIVSGETVNVYTIDGKLVKKNVKAIDAQKNLNKGIYIVGKKKVAVK